MVPKRGPEFIGNSVSQAARWVWPQLQRVQSNTIRCRSQCSYMYMYMYIYIYVYMYTHKYIISQLFTHSLCHIYLISPVFFFESSSCLFLISLFSYHVSIIATPSSPSCSGVPSRSPWRGRHGCRAGGGRHGCTQPGDVQKSCQGGGLMVRWWLEHDFLKWFIVIYSDF